MRKFKENFIVRYADQYMMINLISLRRKIITVDQYKLLEQVYNRYDSIESKNLVEQLYIEKQLLPLEIIKQYDDLRFANKPKFQHKITSVMINLTYDCNFHCEYCYQRDFNYHGKFLTIEDINKIYNFILDYNKLHGYTQPVESVVISGGESLLRQNIETINHIIKLFKGSKIKIFTNGVNILKYAKDIDYSQIQEAQVSLDGPDEVIRLVNKNLMTDVKQIIEGIKLFMNKGVKLDIVALVTKNSIKYIPKFLDILNNDGILNNTPIRFAFAIDHAERYSVDSKLYSLEEYLNLRLQLLELIKGKNATVDSLYELTCLVNVINRKVNERVEGLLSKCDMTKGIPVLFGPDHGIYWCACTRLDRRIGTFDESPAVLDTSELLKELEERNIFNIEKCKVCFYRYVCATGCPLFSIHRNNRGDTACCGILESELFEKNAEKFIMTRI